MSTRALDPDELAALEDQRDFLLSSLDDLEREHGVGDVDDHDYAELRDDYTARAARVIRAIDAHRARAPKPRPTSARRRAVVVGAGVVAFALLAGFLVAQASGRRGAGDTLTGDVRTSAAELLEQAQGLAAERQLDEAIATYDEVLAIDPDNVEAMTYKGWMQLQSGDQQGLVTLVDAAELDPEFPDVHFFLAWAFHGLGRDDTALASLDRLARLDPPPQLALAADDLRAEIESAPAG